MKKINKLFFLFFSIGSLLNPTVSAQLITPDVSFGNNGYVLSNFGNYSDIAFAHTLQPDGKIILAGSISTGPANLAVVRYLSNGSLDTTFDGDGYVQTIVGSFSTAAFSVLVDPDGKILVGGYKYTTDHDFILARYNSNGSLDTSFNSDGIVETPIGAGDEMCQSLALQPDGKIIASGRTQNGTNFDFVTVRYNNNGSIDSTFNSIGYIVTSFGGDDRASSVCLQSDDKIVVSGFTTLTGKTEIAILRLNSNGTLDTSYSSDGMTTAGIIGHNIFGKTAAMQQDDKLVVAGSDLSGNTDFMVARFNSDGSMDTTFDGDGFAFTAVTTDDDYANSVVIQQDGKIIAAGVYVVAIPDIDWVMIRYTSDGSIDSTFDTDGIVTTAIGNNHDACYAISIQNDSKIILAGDFYNSTSNFKEMAVVRFDNITTAVDPKISLPNSIQIFPNPVSNQVKIKGTDENGEMIIYSIEGKEVMRSKTTEHETVIYLHELPIGIYYLTLQMENSTVFFKMIKSE